MYTAVEKLKVTKTSNSGLPAYGRFHQLLAEVKEILTKAGTYTNPAVRNVTRNLMDIQTQEQLEALNVQLETMKTLYGSETVTERQSEHSLAKKALSFWGMSAKDDILAKIQSNDVIEIYDRNGTQLYRSLNFFKTSGYSLEDLLLNQWFVLWDRPKKVMNELMAIMQDLIAGKTECATFEAPDHVIKEILQDQEGEEFHRLLKIKLKMAAPLYFEGTNVISGFVCVSSGEVLGQGHQTDVVAFL